MIIEKKPNPTINSTNSTSCGMVSKQSQPSLYSASLDRVYTWLGQPSFGLLGGIYNCVIGRASRFSYSLTRLVCSYSNIRMDTPLKALPSGHPSTPLSVEEIGKMWESNAELWTTLVRQGQDLYRDNVSTPGFLSILPDVSGLKGLDIGCGEGHNTRLLAEKGAAMTGIDISKTFVALAQRTELEVPQGVHYETGDATKLQFDPESFDFLTAFNVLMDIPDLKTTLSEAYRVLKPGGFLQFTIPHPCTWSHGLEWVTDEKGAKRALAVQGYFSSSSGTVGEWVFDGADPSKGTFRTAIFHRTLSEWHDSFSESGFVLEKILEPKPTLGAVKKHPAIDGSLIAPFFYIARYKKPIK